MSNPQQARKAQRLQLLEDHIGRALADSERSGELRSAPSWGKPLGEDAGYEATPDALRLPFKMLKDAGFVPPEVELMRTIAGLQAELDAAAPGAPGSHALARRVAELRQQLALRLERLRSG